MKPDRSLSSLSSLSYLSSLSSRASLAPFYGLLTPSLQRARLRAALPHVLETGRVLDIGCGLTPLPGRWASYVGCDRDGRVLAENGRRFPGATFQEWDVASEEPPPELKRGAPFDTILMLAVVEHLAAPGPALARVAGLLRTGGSLVATTPAPSASFFLAWGGRLGLLSRHASEEHERLWGRNELTRVATEAGLDLSLYRRFLLGLNQLFVFRGR